MRIPRKHREAYVQLIEAAQGNELCLAECESHGKPGTKVYAICSVVKTPGGVTYVPLARLFNGNPSNEITSPGISARLLI